MKLKMTDERMQKHWCPECRDCMGKTGDPKFYFCNECDSEMAYPIHMLTHCVWPVLWLMILTWAFQAEGYAPEGVFRTVVGVVWLFYMLRRYLRWRNWVTEQGWRGNQALPTKQEKMVEPWRIELQTFALRTSIREQVFPEFQGFFAGRDTYEH